MTDSRFAFQVRFFCLEGLEKVRELFKFYPYTESLTVEQAPESNEQYNTLVLLHDPELSHAVETITKGFEHHLADRRIRLLQISPVIQEEQLRDPPAPDPPDRDLAVSECAYCHCTQANACQTDQGPCHWLPDVRLNGSPVCSHPECVEKFRLGLPGVSLESLGGRDMNSPH